MTEMMAETTLAPVAEKAATRKRKADRIQERQKQQPLSEHELDLYLAAPEVAEGALQAAEELYHQTAASSSTATTSLSRFSPDSELLPGMVLLKNFLSPAQQQRLVDESRAMGLASGGFYKPTYASGAKCRLYQMCVGRHWNVVTEQYEQVRSNHDHASVQPLPEYWKELAVQSLQKARAADPEVMGTCHDMTPDICVVNYYKKAGRNGMHIDKDESPEAMDMGSPVVSFSIGSAAEFAFCDHYPQGQEGVPVVKLESGDVLVFGGASRKVVHALTRVYANTQPAWLRMRSGRLNLTFREYKPHEVQ